MIDYARFVQLLDASHKLFEAHDLGSLKKAIQVHGVALLGGMEAELILSVNKDTLTEEIGLLLDLESLDSQQENPLKPFIHLRAAISTEAKQPSAYQHTNISKTDGKEIEQNENAIQALKAMRPGKSCLASLHSNGQFYGVLIVTDIPERYFDDGDLFILNELARFAAHALRLETIAQDREDRDGLTGLYNQAYLFREINNELDRLKRYGQPLSLVMLDIDHFKNINDRFGHGAGDDVLVQLSAYLLEHSRNQDVVVRYGGEEFALLLPDTDSLAAQTFAERLRVDIQDTQAGAWGRYLGQVTASLGVCSLKLESLEKYSVSPDQAKTTIEYADSALYQAKRLGRNRVCVYQDTF